MRKIEQLIFNGYIKGYVSINKINFVLKTLTEEEIQEIDDLQFFPDYEKSPLIVLYSIKKINSLDILKIRQDHFEELYSYVSKFPAFITKIIFNAISKLNEYIQEKAFVDCKAYFDSNDSKFDFVAFICNKESLGEKLNIFQKFWLNNNFYKEKNSIVEVMWNFSKFLGSFWNPKAVQKIEAREKAQEPFEEYTEEEIKSSDGLIKPIRTKEDIVRELRRQIRGEKDLHDVIVEAYEKKKQEIADKKKEEKKKKYEQHIKEHGEGVISEGVESGIISESKIVDAKLVKDMEKNKSERMKMFKIKSQDQYEKIAKQSIEKYKDYNIKEK